jgi:hypothetical protein
MSLPVFQHFSFCSGYFSVSVCGLVSASSAVISIGGIIGTRPNMMKMAPLGRALAADATFKLRLIHTGQHYDAQMSGNMLKDLGLPELGL